MASLVQLSFLLSASGFLSSRQQGLYLQGIAGMGKELPIGKAKQQGLDKKVAAAAAKAHAAPRDAAGACY